MGFLSDLWDAIPLVGDIASSISGYTKSILNAPLNNYYRHQQKDDAIDLMRTQGEINQNNWMQQFSTISQYNDPAAVKARYQNAGISPAAAFGSSVVGNSTATPTGANVTAQQLPFSSNLNASSLAQITNLMASAALSRAKIPEIDSQIQANLAKAGLDASQESLNKLMHKFETAFGSALRSSKVAEQVGNYVNKLAQAELFAHQGKVAEAEAVLKEAQTELSRATKRLSDAQAAVVEVDAKYEEARISADIEKAKSQSVEARASAKRNYSEASKFDAEKVAQDLSNKIASARNEMDVNNAIFDASVLVPLQQSKDRYATFNELKRELQLSKAYKNSETKQKIDAAIQNLAKLIGLHSSVSVSAK